MTERRRAELESLRGAALEGDAWLKALIHVGDQLPAESALVRSLLASAVSACAEPLVERGWPAETTRRTAAAATAWLGEPSEERWADLFIAATASYPFGPGDGCLALEALGGHGAPGSGCRTGIGFLWDVRNALGGARTRALVEPALIDALATRGG